MKIETLTPKEKTGAATGKVTAKGENWLEIKPSDAPAERYSARWIGGAPKDGGGPDKAGIAAIRETAVGDNVKIEWQYDERLRVVSLRKQ